MDSDVSVVIPTYNRSESLARCVDALPTNVEVIVVDDASTDATRRRIRSLARPLTYLRQPRNAGPAAARNVGIKAATHELVAFTDDDCVPSSGWPFHLVDALARSDGGLAGVGGRVLPLRSSTVARYSTFHGVLEPPPTLAYLVTANCLYRRDVLLAAGGFDESITVAGGEDPGLSARVRGLGYRLAFAPDAIVLHDYRSGMVDFARTFYRYGTGCARTVLAPRTGDESLAENLTPPDLTLSNLGREVVRSWGEYVEATLPIMDCAVFLGLRVVQRLAYNAGWSRVAQELEAGSMASREKSRRHATFVASRLGTAGYAGVGRSRGKAPNPPPKKKGKKTEAENPDDYHPSGDEEIVSDEDYSSDDESSGWGEE